MKIINREKSGGYYFTAYEMNQIFSVENCPAGLLLLYTILDRSGLPIEEIVLDYFTDIHSENGRQIYNKTEFLQEYPSLETLCRKSDIEKMGPWTVELENGAVINGELGRKIRIMYEDECTNYNKVFLNIENETYHYNMCPGELMEYLEKVEQMSEPLAVEVLQGLEEYEDLYQEFSSCIKDGRYVFPENPIAVEGYTAERLMKEVGFHPIGAYRSLVWLRKDPQKELKKIEKGLIWK